MHKNNKINIVLIGAAGSGKGTQGVFLAQKYGLFQVSAGDALRQYRKDKNAKYTHIIDDLIDHGMLVPTHITNEIVSNYIEEKCDHDLKCNGVIFDGFPREIAQLEFLDSFLRSRNEKIDAVILIDVPVEELIDRLSGRFSCAHCGEIYHKKTKSLLKDGVCDKCGFTEFFIRDDDKNIDAIKKRFTIFENQTKDVLNNYKERELVISVNGKNCPKKIFDEIITKLDNVLVKK